MKTILTCVAVFVTLATLAFAGVPHTINYQGYLKDGSGAPVNNTATPVRFSLYSSSSPRNNPVWQESTSVTPVNGVYSVQLGSVTPITATFDVPYFLGLKVGVDTEMPLQPLGSAPYAMRASVAESAGSVGGQTLAQLDSRYLDPTRPAPTAQQLATLRWDQVAGGASGTYPVGLGPSALVFDGSSIWVANGADNTVSKLNPASGATIGTYPVGTGPYSLAFDGVNIWVANSGNNTVSKLNPATGATIGIYPVGINPYALTFDGTNIWVANNADNTVTKLNPATGATIGTYPVGANPRALAFDGSSIWVACYGDSAVQKINPATGATIGTYPVGSTNIVHALAFDGTSLWVAIGYGGLSKLNPTTGATIGTYLGGTYPYLLAFDGMSLWVANYPNRVSKMDPATGATIATYPIANNSSSALAFDGKNIWVSHPYWNTVTKIVTTTDIIPLSSVSAGSNNSAGGRYSTVSGGFANTTDGFYSTVPGGSGNTVGPNGDYSFAAGYRAKANESGMFVWSDTKGYDYDPTQLRSPGQSIDTFNVRATGGVLFTTGLDVNGRSNWGCYTYNGAGWICTSDRNVKRNLVAVDGQVILSKLAAMPVYHWQPKDGPNAEIRHVGPMAQDFYATFGLGDSDTAIGMQDVEGIALAAIQGLNAKLAEHDIAMRQLVREKDAQLLAQTEKISALDRERAQQSARIEALEQQYAQMTRLLSQIDKM